MWTQIYATNNQKKKKKKIQPSNTEKGFHLERYYF